MILDTTYLLPLVRIGIERDLLAEIASHRVDLELADCGVSSISIFELQAKSAKLSIPAKFVTEGLQAIEDGFRVHSFHDPDILGISFELRKLIPDYIDAVIVATAAARDKQLLTEDSRILRAKGSLEKDYGLKVSSFREILDSHRSTTNR